MKLSDHPLLKPYVGKSAVLDSNVLLLYWAMHFDPRLIHTFKRLNSFQEKDFILLCEILKIFRSIRTTPHVLTEVSNLANSLPENRKNTWVAHFSRHIQVIKEDFVSAAAIASGPLMHLGLTDAGLAALASDHVILTIDFPLSKSLESRGLNVINFTHLRSLWLE
jgi:hypothetical protein